MKSTIFRAIANYLATELNNQIISDVYGNCNFIARFNNQVSNLLMQENGIPFPAIFIEFPNSDNWNTRTNNQQTGSMLIRVHIAQHNKSTTNWFANTAEFDEGMKRDEYVQTVHNLLQGLSVASGTMQRVGMYEDNNHDHIILDTIEYSAEVEDTCSNPRNDYTEVTGTDLEVENDQSLQRPGQMPPYVFDLHDKI